GLIRSCLGRSSPRSSLLFFFSEPATPEIYTLSLHDALPIWSLAGLCTMIGNLAGSLTNIFFLAMRLPKNEFVGTAAWLFFITNLFKLPFHIFVWKTISTESLLINLKLLPAIFVGLVLGVFLVKKINEKNYKRFILIVTAIGAVAILFR